ncbi:hypothetical protein ACA910_004116 [Epithemia clementina (nom. ined.)]
MAKQKKGVKTAELPAEKPPEKQNAEGDEVKAEEDDGEQRNDDTQPNNEQEVPVLTTTQSIPDDNNNNDNNPIQDEVKVKGDQTGDAAAAGGDENNDNSGGEEQIKLFRSSRLKGYLTLVLASIINYDAASKSENVIKASGAIPSTDEQQNYALSVAIVSLILTGWATLVHLDTITPLEKAWIAFFKPKSRFELVLAVVLVIWWSVATGIQTSVNGIAGDGKEQYSLYFSCWACCFASYWVLERWWVAAGLASLKAFITSWPYRSPGWLCIFFMGVFTLIWYLDLWQNRNKLDRESVNDPDKKDQLNQLVIHFEQVPEIQWQLMIALIVFTITPAAAFVLAEIFRQTKPDGSNEEKSKAENTTEGISLLMLVLAWVPSIIWVTAPDGAASLVGNAYFSSWLLVIFVAETGVWFVHDLRERIHRSLEQKQLEYREKQRQVIEKARAIQQQKLAAVIPHRHESLASENDDQSDSLDREDDSSSSFVDVLTEF